MSDFMEATASNSSSLTSVQIFFSLMVEAHIGPNASLVELNISNGYSMNGQQRMQSPTIIYF